MTIEEIGEKVSRCRLCELAKGRTHAVPGEGNSHAAIMFIGEGPGKNEDEQGRPFCGASGKFLDELLKSIRLERKDVFITNVVKCRPPGNRDPLPEEIAICTKHYLFSQIETINPEIVCFLGRYSMGLFMKGMKISQIHGKAYRKDNRFYIAFYHPAVALYNGGMRTTLLADFQVLDKILKGKYARKENVIEGKKTVIRKNPDTRIPLEF